MSRADRVARVIRDDVRAARAYHVADHDGLLKLDAMENPFPLPVSIRDALQERLGAVALNRYPDPVATPLVAELRRVMGIEERHRVLLGNGSDELIALLIQAVAGPDSCVMAPSPSFVMYRVLSEALGQRFVELPLNERFDLDPEQALAVIEHERPTLLFLASPNNPSGNHLGADAMRAVIAASPGLVVVDEAYFAFNDRDHRDWLDEFDNLLLMRTLSKLGLAGLRLGFLWGAADWIDEIDKLRLPYNVNSLSQLAAQLALERFPALVEQTALLRAERERLAEGLTALGRFDVYPSDANFLLLRDTRAAAGALFDALLSRGILIKKLDGSHPRLAQCLRVTVGTAEENARLLAELGELAGR